jgi:hypothetical protein
MHTAAFIAFLQKMQPASVRAAALNAGDHSEEWRMRQIIHGKTLIVVQRKVPAFILTGAVKN